MSPFERVFDICHATTDDLRALAELATDDPRHFYVGANFRDLDLRGVDLRGFVLSGASFRGALVDDNTLVDEEFRQLVENAVFMEHFLIEQVQRRAWWPRSVIYLFPKPYQDSIRGLRFRRWSAEPFFLVVGADRISRSLNLHSIEDIHAAIGRLRSEILTYLPAHIRSEIDFPLRRDWRTFSIKRIEKIMIGEPASLHDSIYFIAAMHALFARKRIIKDGRWDRFWSLFYLDAEVFLLGNREGVRRLLTKNRKQKGVDDNPLLKSSLEKALSGERLSITKVDVVREWAKGGDVELEWVGVRPAVRSRASIATTIQTGMGSRR